MLRKTFAAAMFSTLLAVPLSSAFAGPGDTPGAPAAAAPVAAPAAPAPAAGDATGKPGAIKPKKPVSAKQQAQRDKMKSCNADAKTKGLKGADRKTYMSTCLKGPA